MGHILTLLICLYASMKEKGGQGMKKEWHAPQMKTLNVQETASGAVYYPKEGIVVFDPEDGGNVHVGPTTS